MKHRLKALERRLVREGAQQSMSVVGDGVSWRETLFDYTNAPELASMLWNSFPAPSFTSAQLERLEAQGVQISRLRVLQGAGSIDGGGA